MDEATALAYLAEVEARLGLPTVDPFRQGAGRLVDALRMRLTRPAETFPLARVFTISRGSRTEARVLTVTVEDGGAAGPRRMRALRALRRDARKRHRADREPARALRPRARLQTLLPPGAARNAVDCALWDLEAKRSGRRVWELAGLPEPGPEITAYTLSLDTPEAMRAEAARHAHRPLLKIKLGGEGDMARLEAVRAGAPQARIIVDANEGWTPEAYAALAPALRAPRRRAGRAAAARRRRRRARPRWPARCRSAPTRAATTAPACRRSAASTTWSTSSSTRPAA